MEEILKKIGGMKGQDLSNTVEALVFLEESFPIDRKPDTIAASAAQLNLVLSGLKGKDLMFTVPVMVWACVKSNVYNADLLAAVAQRFSSQRALWPLPDWGLCALHLGIGHGA